MKSSKSRKILRISESVFIKEDEQRENKKPLKASFTAHLYKIRSVKVIILKK